MLPPSPARRTLRQFAAGLAMGLLALASSLTQAQTQTSAAAERRVALVVGNSAYKLGPLKNPGNDAAAVAASLRRLGIEVVERQNVSRESFALGVREFGDKLRGASVGLFYFAGHGLQVRGRNFLVPVDADIAREDEVPYRSIDVNEVLDKMDSARTPINLVLLDACRNNPFARSFKLSQVGLAQMDAPSGTLIGFATSPGSVAQDGEGDNGLYTSALLRHMSEGGLPIEQMLKRVRVDVVRASNNSQVPWEASSLNRDFFFKPLAGAPAKPAEPAADDLSMELAFWDAVKGSSSPADYLAYLEQYPKGRFAALARLRAGRPAAEGRVQPEAVPPATAPSLTAVGKPVRAESPEGLYSAIADAGSLRFVDASRRTVSELSLDDSKRLVVHALAFSADGRWLAVSGSREGRGVQMLVSVSEARVAWERAGVALSFDSTQPLAQLQLASGELELVGLMDSRGGTRP